MEKRKRGKKKSPRRTEQNEDGQPASLNIQHVKLVSNYFSFTRKNAIIYRYKELRTLHDRCSILSSFGFGVAKEPTHVDGIIFNPPKLKFGNGEILNPIRLKSNMKVLYMPARIRYWAIFNMSPRCDMTKIARDLIQYGKMIGFCIDRPGDCYNSDILPDIVDEVFDMLTSLPSVPDFVLFIPPLDSPPINGLWNRKCIEFGIRSHTIDISKVESERYLMGELLHINIKLGGINYALDCDEFFQKPTMILGMTLCPVDRGQEGIHVAAVVGTKDWQSMTTYKAVVRSQSGRKKKIANLYDPRNDGSHGGMIRELLIEYNKINDGKRPEQVIIFRDGASIEQITSELEDIQKVV